MAGLLRFLPVVICILLPATFVVSYIISVSLKHVFPLFPNISDTGSKAPESCFFSLMLNFSAALMAFAIYIRQKQIKEYFRVKQLDYPIPMALKVNKATAIVGLIACGGLDLAANFQETRVRIVHDIGILLCFWCGTVYILLQALLSFWMIPDMNSSSMVLIRGIMGISSLVFVVLNQVADDISRQLFTGNVTAILEWQYSEPGYAWHATSSVSEWILVVILALFILSYYGDFQRISFYAPELTITDEPVPQPVMVRRYTNYGFIPN